MDAILGWFTSVNVAVVTVTVSILCVYLYRHFTSIRRAGFDGPTPWPVVGNLLQQFSLGIKTADAEWTDKYGKVFGYYNGFETKFCISDPDILKTVMVKDFTKFMDRPVPKTIPKLMADTLFFMRGRTWKKTRNIITPSFSAANMKQLVPTLNKCAEQLAANIAEHCDEDVEIRKFFIHFTMDAIASVAFGIETDSQKSPDDPFVSNIEQIFKPTMYRRIVMMTALSIPPLGTLLTKLGIHVWPQSVIDFYQKTGQMLIDDRRQNKKTRIDFIQMLLEADFDSSKIEHMAHGASINGAANGAANGTANGAAKAANGTADGQNKGTTEKLTDDVINAQAFVFFLAGFETTSSLLRYCAYTLAVQPELDKMLYDEIMEQIGDEAPTYESVAKLKNMDMFIDEALRFYPPIVRLGRTVADDVVIDNKQVPKGSTVVVPVYLIHHNPEFYPDPETFDPQRFSPEKKTESSHTDGITYLPFGVGPRHCIGMRLALVEAKIALVYVLRKVKFAKCEQTQVPLDLQYVGLLKPKKPIQLRLQQR